MKFFNEIYFCNSEEDLAEVSEILKKSEIDFSINKKDDYEETNPTSYKFSISVPENQAETALNLLQNNVKESKAKTEVEKEIIKHIPKTITATLASLVFACTFLTLYKIGEKIYLNYENKKQAQKKEVLKTKSQNEQTPITQTKKAKNEITSEEFQTKNEDDYSEELQKKNHGIKTYKTAKEIELPADFEIQVIFDRPFDYGDYCVENDFVEQTDMFYENDTLKIQISAQDIQNYAPFYLCAQVLNKEFVTDVDYFREEDFYDPQGRSFRIPFKNYYYENDSLSYSVSLITKQNDSCLLQRFFTVEPSKETVIFDSNFDRKNPFGESVKTLNANEKYVLYFPQTNQNSGRKNDSVIFSTRISCFNGFKIATIPFANYKVSSSINKMNEFVFSFDEPLDFHIDFFDSQNMKVDYNHSADCNFFVENNANSKTTTIQKHKVWIVDSPEGLNVRSRPYGKKIGGIPDKTIIIQTEETLCYFDDYIDGIYGFWIPVKIDKKDLKKVLEPEEPVYSTNEETTGWVFSGYCCEAG